MEQYEEIKEYYFTCRIAFDDQPLPKDFDFDTLEDLLFHLSYIITSKQFHAIRVIKKEKKPNQWVAKI